MQKVGRNDPCPCGSGKKLKKCCEESGKKKKINAHYITEEQKSTALNHAQKLSHFFQRTVTPVSPTEIPSSQEESQPEQNVDK